MGVVPGPPQAIQGIVNTVFWLYCVLNFSESKNQTVATRWQIFRLKYTKLVIGWGSAPDPAGGAYPDPLAGSSWIPVVEETVFPICLSYSYKCAKFG